MEPQSTTPPQNDVSAPSYKPQSTALLILKAIVIAAVLVAVATFGTRMVLAMMPS
jgi:cell division protein FtsL